MGKKVSPEVRRYLAALGKKGGKAGGRKGGHNRAAKLTPEQRSEIARRGGQARWNKKK